MADVKIWDDLLAFNFTVIMKYISYPRSVMGF